MINNKVYIILLNIILYSCYFQVFAQDNILFVTYNLSENTDPSIEQISVSLSGNVINNVDRVKAVMEFSNYFNRSGPNIERIQTKVRDFQIKYVLKIDNIIKTGPIKYEVFFSFYKIDAELKETPVIWDNSSYLVEKKTGQPPSNISEILKDLNNEINFYLNNQTIITEFRPRIYINRDKFTPSSAEEKIQFDIFCDWLEQTLNENSSVITNRYNYYDDDKEIYPDSASIILYGKFTDIPSNDSTIDVELIIKKGNRTRRENPAVTIYITDFENDNFSDNTPYEQRFKNDILNMLNVIIR